MRGSAEVTELEVLEGEMILGERENLSEGLSGGFALTLEEGEYILRCNGGDEEDGTLNVTGKLESEGQPRGRSGDRPYHKYLDQNTDERSRRPSRSSAASSPATSKRRKQVYPAPRVPYERIEPVAESFGDLDPRIDARENDVPKANSAASTDRESALGRRHRQGHHRSPKQLLADVEELRKKVKTVDLQAVQIANGANELLGEVSASKITGEEERYSHIDLVDFEANVEGAEVAFEAVEPLLSGKDPKLAKEIEADFKKVYAAWIPIATAPASSSTRN